MKYTFTDGEEDNGGGTRGGKQKAAVCGFG